MTPAELDDAYANAAYIDGAMGFPPRWAAEAQAFREGLGARAETGVAYGAGDAERFDVFWPEGQAKGVIVFVHGGYWKAFGRSDWSAFAEGGLARGYAVAMPGYPQAPGARISEITTCIARAVDAIALRVAGPVFLMGHSAGGHLVARMMMGDVPLAVRDRIAGCVPISPVGDLRPLVPQSMNDVLRLTEAEAMAESPTLGVPAVVGRTHVWVGAEERPAFLEQARGLAQAWGAPLSTAPGRHHFDVIDTLKDADSPLLDALLG